MIALVDQGEMKPISTPITTATLPSLRLFALGLSAVGRIFHWKEKPPNPKAVASKSNDFVTPPAKAHGSFRPSHSSGWRRDSGRVIRDR